MRRALLILAAVLLLAAVGFALGPGRTLWALLHPPQQDLPLPDALIALEAADGQRMLAAAPQADYAALSTHFETQQHGSYCGVASSVIALNTLGLSTTQDEFFIPGTAAVRKEREVLFGGMNLDALGGLLTAYGVIAVVHHTEDVTIDLFRQAAKANLAMEGDLVLVNYHRPTLEQEGGGHISPLAAYDEQSDRFLILDTATYKYPPVWVEAEALWAAMSTTDSDGGRTRGFVLISR